MLKRTLQVPAGSGVKHSMSSETL